MSFPGLVEYDMEDLRQEFGRRQTPPEYEILSDLIGAVETALYRLGKIGKKYSDIGKTVRNVLNILESEADR